MAFIKKAYPELHFYYAKQDVSTWSYQADREAQIMDDLIKQLSVEQMCRLASVNLYTLACRTSDEDTAARALFFLSELEHYNADNPPTATRKVAIARFVLSCRHLRQRLETLAKGIPELSELS